MKVAPICLAIAGLLVSSAALSQNVVITNADNRTIPLEANSVVHLSANGDLLVKCALAGGVCKALANQPTPTPPPPTTGCTLTGPLIAPGGLTRISKTWVQAWSAPNGSAIAVYPDSISSPTPIGSEKGHYTAISFVPTANLDVQITWDGAQPQGAIGYSSPRPTSIGMFIGISPCAGDLRPANDSSSEPFERSVCRTFDTQGGISYSTRAAANSDVQCKLTAGVTYYINVAPINTTDGLTLPEDSCNNTLSGCDVQAIHRRQ